METIWKYEIEPNDNQILELPSGAEILDVQIQGDDPMLWVKVDPNNAKLKYRVQVIGTGWLRDIHGKYAGTFQVHQSGLVFHVFIAQL